MKERDFWYCLLDSMTHRLVPRNESLSYDILPFFFHPLFYFDLWSIYTDVRFSSSSTRDSSFGMLESFFFLTVGEFRKPITPLFACSSVVTTVVFFEEILDFRK